MRAHKHGAPHCVRTLTQTCYARHYFTPLGTGRGYHLLEHREETIKHEVVKDTSEEIYDEIAASEHNQMSTTQAKPLLDRTVLVLLIIHIMDVIPRFLTSYLYTLVFTYKYFHKHR